MTRTAACYRLYALPGNPPRPGMVRVRSGGVQINLEVWRIPEQEVGGLLTLIPAPLGLGSVELADHTLVTGFICEGYGVADAVDISQYRGWRAYMEDGRSACA